MNRVFIIMGVSGCGKTTFGKELANLLLLPYYDGDDFHPASNIIKMTNGTALTDEDRFPWLKILSVKVEQWSTQGGAVLSCSALKDKYRKIIAEGSCEVTWVYLKAEPELILQRMNHREGHFMPSSLMSTQFEDLEEPADGIFLDASLPVPRNIAILLNQINKHSDE